jgi:hypothetical protein
MQIKGLAVLIPVLAAAGPAAAEVKSVTANGFEVASTATIAAPPTGSMPHSAKSAAGGARLTPSRAMPPISVWNCGPAAVFASG